MKQNPAKNAQKVVSMFIPPPPPPPCKIAIFFLGILLLFACDDFNRSLIPFIKEATTPYTITFNSVGGTPVAPVTLFGGSKGGWVNFPTPTSGYGTFAGWYLDADRTKPFTVFTEAVELYAKWNAYYEIGDTGPGGGIIFHREELGFPVEGYTHPDNPNYSFPTYTAYYLEVAPTDWYGTDDHPLIAFARPVSEILTTAVGTTSELGIGRQNTIKFYILYLDDVPAVKACIDYNGGGKTDWFLPSMNELQLLHTMEVVDGGNTWPSDGHLSSSEVPPPSGGIRVLNSGGTTSVTTKSSLGIVRPIRAF